MILAFPVSHAEDDRLKGQVPPQEVEVGVLHVGELLERAMIRDYCKLLPPQIVLEFISGHHMARASFSLTIKCCLVPVSFQLRKKIWHSPSEISWDRMIPKPTAEASVCMINSLLSNGALGTAQSMFDPMEGRVSFGVPFQVIGLVPFPPRFNESVSRAARRSVDQTTSNSWPARENSVGPPMWD